MVRRNLIALAFALLSTNALAQNVPNHAVPIGRGTGTQGWGVGGPCAVNQVLSWTGGATADPTCVAQGGSANIINNGSTITSGVVSQILFENPLGTLSEITKANNSVLVTNGSGVPSWATSFPAGITFPAPGTNTVPLTALSQIAARSVLGNKTAGLANVTAAWTVPNSTDSTIPLVNGTPTATHATCFNDTVGQLVDCGFTPGSAPAATIGTAGATVPLLSTTNTWSGATNAFQAITATDLTVSGPVTISVRVVTTTPVTVSNTTDYFICVNQSAGITVNLPTSHNPGDTYVVKDCSGTDATNNILVATTNNDLIDKVNATSTPFKMQTSATGNFDRAAFTWSGNGTFGWMVN